MKGLATVLLLFITCCALMPPCLHAMSYDYIYDSDLEYYNTAVNEG